MSTILAELSTKLLAADGHPYDIPNEGTVAPYQIEIIHYLRPEGKRERVLVDIGDDALAARSRNLVLTMENLDSGTVNVTCRRKNESEQCEISELCHAHIVRADVFRKLIEAKSLKN